MAYTFNIIGVSPILQFFNQQQNILQYPDLGVQYLSSYRCTLDDLINSAESVADQSEWDLDAAIQTIVDFWMMNSESIDHWKRRLADAGSQSLLVSRLADMRSLTTEFERLLQQ